MHEWSILLALLEHLLEAVEEDGCVLWLENQAGTEANRLVAAALNTWC